MRLKGVQLNNFEAIIMLKKYSKFKFNHCD